MNAVVVRDQATGVIVCMGPANGMYDPGVPVGCTKTVEPDYDILIQQHCAELAARPKPPSLEDRIRALEQKVG